MFTQEVDFALKRLLLGALLLLTLLAACTPSQAETPSPSPEETPTPSPEATDYGRLDIFAMDTVMTLQVYGPNAEEDLSAISYEINHSGGAPVQVGEDALYLATLAQELGDRTGGALDVTMYPVVKLWGFTTSEYHVPSETEINEVLARVDYTALDISEADMTLALPDGMEMDLGAIAKGYAGERAADLLRERGVTTALLNMGGNVQTVGAKTDGSPWRIGIQDPNGDHGAYLGVLEVIDQAAVTSGGYERYFEQDGVTYWHIMDPHTGAPARSGLTSVTIVGDKGGLCDGLSTSLFVLGREKAMDYWRTYGGFEAILVEDREVWITGGLADSFALMPDNGYTLHIVEE